MSALPIVKYILQCSDKAIFAALADNYKMRSVRRGADVTGGTYSDLLTFSFHTLVILKFRRFYSFIFQKTY